MKKLSIFTIILLFISVNAIAQKQVRDSIKAGNKAYQQQLLGTAESNYKAAIQQNPTAKEAIFNLANTHFKQGKWDEALKGYQHYLTLETKDPQRVGSALHNMGNTFLKKKDLQKSLEAYKESLRANPTNEKTRYNLAVVKKMLDDQNKDQNKDQNQQQNQDKNQDKQDQNKDQNQQNQNKDQKPEKQENESMSESNAKQILQAIEQDEKETQERVKQMKAKEEQKRKDQNKKQDKDW